MTDPFFAAEERRRRELARGAGPRRNVVTTARGVNRQLRAMGRPAIRNPPRELGGDALVVALGAAALGGLALLWWRNRDRRVELDSGAQTYLHGTDLLAA